MRGILTNEAVGSHVERYTGEFDTPWYYGRFRCKGGACRHTCCAGLAVTVSQEEYFRLAGIACSSSLRSDLDVALDPLRDADPYRYAALMPNYFGRCRLLDEKGLCRLQEECGMTSLPAGCRYFPRSPRFTGCGQCSVSNACEETLELFYGSDRPWSEMTQILSFDLNGSFPTDRSAEAQRKLRLHREAVQIMAQEQFSLEWRLSELDGLCRKAECGEQAPVPDALSLRSEAGQGQSGMVDRALLQRLFQELGETYESLRPYCEIAAIDLLQANAVQESGTEEKSGTGAQTDQWIRGRLTAVRAHFPGFDHFLTLVLANDLFYRFFPYTEKGVHPRESAAALHCMTAMLLYLSGSCLNESSTGEELIDLYAAFFRMVELTPFDRNCQVVLHEVDWTFPTD